MLLTASMVPGAGMRMMMIVLGTGEVLERPDFS